MVHGAIALNVRLCESRDRRLCTRPKTDLKAWLRDHLRSLWVEELFQFLLERPTPVSDSSSASPPQYCDCAVLTVLYALLREINTACLLISTTHLVPVEELTTSSANLASSSAESVGIGSAMSSGTSCRPPLSAAL